MNNNMMLGNGINSLISNIRSFLGISRGSGNVYNNRCAVRILTVEDAYMQIMSGNTKILDVRTENEYRVMRIKGAINVPINILSSNIQNILPNKQECILIYCACGPRAAQAVQIMKNMGYSNLCIWEGAGINNFKYKDIIERYDDNGDRVVVS